MIGPNARAAQLATFERSLAARKLTQRPEAIG
jgi:hypothetical protein